MAIYVQIGATKGTGDFSGNVSTAGYEEWIEIDSFTFGVDRPTTMTLGRHGSRESALPTFTDITLVKQMDASSPYIFQSLLKGGSFEIAIHITKTGKTDAEPIVKYALGHALFSHYSVNGDGGYPNETIMISFATIEMNYTPYDTDLNPQSQIPVSYDLATTTVG